MSHPQGEPVAAPAPVAVVLAVDVAHDPGFAAGCAETCNLARAAGYTVAEVMTVRRAIPDRARFIGSGRVKDLASRVAHLRADTVIVNHTLSNSQHARLREAVDTELLDHSGLILTIFASRARTAEGKLQVELAQELYGRAKLKGTWTHLERQRGGLGATGGPGERQLELDRRQARRRIGDLRRRLARRARHVALVTDQRRKRVRSVVLVGYTNAGKSTLFQQLTGAQVPASSRLFETLGTTTRRLYLGEGSEAVLSDTVGFVRNLPHALIEAFRSTLAEVAQADLALVVVDAADDGLAAKLATIEATMAEIGAVAMPCVLVLNKVDQLPGGAWGEYPSWDRIVATVEVSALSGQGVPRLREVVASRLATAAAHATMH